ncbi:MAG: TlpA disulfide reductase family protein [Fimbriimonadaceae bacterium]
MIRLALATFLAAATVGAAVAQDFSRVLNRALPNFTAKDTNGRTVNNASLRGQVVLLDFWATWCGPCKAAKPTMKDLHNRFHARGLRVIGATFQDDPAELRKYLRANPPSFTYLESADALGRQLGITSIPGFVIVDRQGIVRHVIVGFNRNTTPGQLERAITPLLAQR